MLQVSLSNRTSDRLAASDEPIATPADTDLLYYILQITIDYDSDRVFFNEIKGACLEHADALVAVAKKHQDTIVRRPD